MAVIDYPAIAILDIALNYLHIKSEKDYKYIYQVELLDNMDGVYINDMNMVCQKLFKDGYIVCASGPYYKDGTDIRISFDGKIFQEAGGYKEEEKRKKIEIANIEFDTKKRSDNEEQLVLWTKILSNRTSDLTYWTRLVALGAIGLVIWEIFVFIWEHF